MRFNKADGWTKAQSRKWVEDHDGFTDGYEETIPGKTDEGQHRWRQYDPESAKFDYFTFTDDLPKGVSFINGRPKDRRQQSQGSGIMKTGAFKHEQSKGFSEIPAAACILTVGEFELGDNGDGAKSAPVRLVARSGEAIEHWFWGRVVHDLEGMQLSKPRIPIDYVHDPKEVIGYLNKFDTETGALVTRGALVPFKESDRATEIIHKQSLGVPYEASINFGGDGIKVQEIAEDEVTEVNGRKFEGPGIVVREWPLRGVAIAPYGADANTESTVLAGNNAKTYSAAVIFAPEATTKETVKMKDAQESVEVGAKAETPKAEEKLTETVEAESEEVTPEKAEAVEAPKAEESGEKTGLEAATEEVVETEPEKPTEPKPELSREEFTRIADKFGNDVAAQTMKDGGNYASALELAFENAAKERDALAAKLSQSGQNGKPVPVVEAVELDENGKPKDGKLFHTGK
jgi:hypothetical protein